MAHFPKTNLTAIILSGGQSSRMGEDKALLIIDGIPLLTRTCNLALTVATTVYLVTPWIERYQAIAPPGCQWVREVWPETITKSPGPLWAFARIFPLVETEWILLLACDLPYLTRDFLQEQTEQLAQLPTETQAFLAHSKQGWEPLSGFYRRSCLFNLSQFLERGGRSFQHWLKDIKVSELTLVNNQIVFNCNTPDDFAKVKTP